MTARLISPKASPANLFSHGNTSTMRTVASAQRPISSSAGPSANAPGIKRVSVMAVLVAAHYRGVDRALLTRFCRGLITGLDMENNH